MWLLHVGQPSGTHHSQRSRWLALGPMTECEGAGKFSFCTLAGGTLVKVAAVETMACSSATITPLMPKAFRFSLDSDREHSRSADSRVYIFSFRVSWEREREIEVRRKRRFEKQLSWRRKPRSAEVFSEEIRRSVLDPCPRGGEASNRHRKTRS